MKQIQTNLAVGAEKPFVLLHASDTHLTFADERDGERKMLLAKKRQPLFPDGTAALREISALSKALSAPIVYTGDLIDFVSAPNLEYAKRFTDENDCFFTAGNHEFSLYVGEAFEDEAYRAQSLSRVQASFRNDIRFASRVINGVNLVAVDDSYYRFDEAQLAALRREAEKGLPILLFMHCALYEQALCDENRLVHGAEAPYLTAPPASALADVSEYRRRQQMPDGTTREAADFIRKEPLIKAVFTGHFHWDYDGMLTADKPQYVTGTETIRILRVE